MSAPPRQHLLFLTGKLAEKHLRAVLQEMQPVDFSYEVRNIGISVAALMTAKMIERRLGALQGVDRIIVPGLCRGNLEETAERLGVPCLRGPAHLKALPEFFGRAGKAVDLGRFRARIFAEITDAPLLSVAACLERAEAYRRDGADVIDIGCLPETPFPHLEEVVERLHAADCQVSVDSLASDDLLRAGRAGADYLLSLRESTLWLADEVPATPVLIPETPGDMPSLYRAVEQLSRQGRDCYADPVLDPIHFGFVDSISRYRDLRRDYPQAPILMGTGNVTELTEADTTGINALLFGIVSELDIQAVLVTQVSNHCRSVIREADRARRIMACARADNDSPKGLDDGLSALHHCHPFPYRLDEVQALSREVRDPSYRVQITEQGLHVYNRDGLHSHVDPFALFPLLADLQEDAAHAFYMGVELARARIAWQLGKPYDQDQELRWGVAVEPGDDGPRSGE